MQQISGSQSDSGAEYRNKVITYAAINLSLNQNVKDFVIHSKRKAAGTFDDVIIKVQFKEEHASNPYIYLIKTKYDSKEKPLNINKNIVKLFESYNQVMLGKSSNKIFENVPDDNVMFGFFCNNKVAGDTIRKNFSCDIIKRNNEDITIFPFGNRNICSSQLHLEVATKYKAFFDHFYLHVDQPSHVEIMQEINKLCKTFGSVSINNYILDYFKIPELRKNGLPKKIFETQLLKLRLSNYIVTPTEIVSIHQEQAKIWNKIILEHDITLIDDTMDIERSLFGCFEHKVNQLLENTLEWNHSIKTLGKLDQISIEKFKEISQNLGARQWTSAPGTVKTLVEELWACDQLPIILRASQPPSILEEYKHLNKRFIIIGDFKRNIFCVINSWSPKIFANADSICSDYLKNELLEEICVSLQGHKPVRLCDIVENNQKCLMKLTCSLLLRLIRKRKVHLQEECLESLESIVFVIEDHNSKLAVNIDEIEPNEYNTYEINCQSHEVQTILKQIQEKWKYKYHSIIHLRKSIDSKLEFVDGDKRKLRNYFIDENGDDVYCLDVDQPIPIIGRRLENREPLYMPRYFRKAVIQQSIFKTQEKRICFVSGEVESLHPDIKHQIICEFAEEKVQAKLENNQNVLLDANKYRVEEYWDVLSTKECPLFHVNIVDGDMIMLKYRNCDNMNAFLSYSKETFEERTFFAEVPGKITVLSGESGIGKSSLLHSLSEMLDERNYTLFCNLAECRDALKSDNQDVYDSSLDFIFDKYESSIFKDLMRGVYEYHKDSGRVIVFIDAFDEVLPIRKEAVLKLMENLLKYNIKIVVASRLFFDTVLINKFEVRPVKIDNLSRRDSEKYFESQGLLDLKVNDIPIEVLTNPLFLKFLCYLFWQGALDYTKLTRYDVFKNVIMKKTERYYRKSSQAFSKSLEAYTRKILDIHKHLAVVVMFDKEMTVERGIFEDYEESVKLFKDLKIKLGIVKYFNKDYAVFLHQSFAEYFAAGWLSEKLIDEDFDETAQALYNHMVLNHDRSFRYFYDNMVCENMKLHKAVLEGKFAVVKELTAKDPKITRCVDKCNRNSLLLAASYCYDRNYAVLEELVLKTYLHLPENMDKSDTYMQWNWIECLHILSKGCFLDHAYKRNLAVTVFLYLIAVPGATITSKNILDACEHFNIDIAYILLSRKPSLLSEYYNIVMEIAMKRGRADIIYKLLELKYIFNAHIFYSNPKSVNLIEFINDSTRGDFTALHLACMIGIERIITDLINFDYEIYTSSLYSKDIYGNIPLCYTIMQGNFKVLSLITESMKDMSFIDNYGNTLLHLACKHLNVAAIDLLLKRDVDINARNIRGERPIHAVACLKWEEIKEIGLAIVAKEMEERKKYSTFTEQYIINMSNSSASYHMSEIEIENTCQVAIYSVLDTLLAHYANITERDNEGNTALHLAYLHSNKFVLDYLIEETKEMAFMRNKNGLSVFDFAKKDRNLKMLKSLQKKSVSVDAFSTNTGDDSSTDDDRMFMEEDLELQDQSDTIPDSIISGVSLLDLQEESSIKSDLKFMEGQGRILLHKATEEGRSDIIQFLVDKSFPTDVPDDEGYIPLHFANCENDANLLLNNHRNLKDINRKSHNGETPLHTASRNGRLDVARTLLSVNADCTIKNAFGLTTLHTAFITNNEDIMKLLLDHGADVNAITKGGATVLHLATSKGDASLVEYLLHKEADITLQDDLGNTPLHLACQHGFVPIVKILVSRSSQVITFYNKKGYRPYDLACINGKCHVVEYFIKNCTALNPRVSEDILHEVVENGHLALMEMLFAEKIVTKDDLQCKGKDDCTLLHVAVARDYRNLVGFLLKNGVKVNTVNVDLYNPLHMVQSIECAEMLFSKYSNASEAHTKSKYNETPLHMACKGIDADLVKVILNNGAGVSCKDIVGWTPLHIAVSSNAIDTVKVLLAKGASVNEPNNYFATALHIAAADNTFIVELLLEHGADINVITRYGSSAIKREIQLDETQRLTELIETTDHTILDMACLYGQHDVINYLLVQFPVVKNFRIPQQVLFNIGDWRLLWKLFREEIISIADLRSRKNNGNTLVHAAAACGNIDIIRFLEYVGIEMNTSNKKEESPLVLAALENHIEVVQYLLPHSGKGGVPQASTVLHASVSKNNVKLVRKILEYGFDVNVTVRNGNSTLHTAVIAGYSTMVDILIEYKVDIELVNKCGWTAFDVACILNRCTIIKSLLKAYPTVRKRKLSNNAIFGIVRKGSLKSLKVLLEENGLVASDLHIIDDCQRTLLHVATDCRHTDVIQFLLQKGVKVNPLDCEGRTPLHLAQSAEDAKLLVIHYENSEDINSKTIRGATPLHIAAYSGFADVVQVLLDAKADVFVTMKDGSTPLHVATEKIENVNIVQMLLQHGAPVNHVDKTLKTALHIAASVNALEVVNLLVNHGADVELKDDEDNTPLHLACKRGYLKIVEYLTGFRDSTILLRNKNEFSPFDYACLCGNSDVIEYFLKLKTDLLLSGVVFRQIIDLDQLALLKLLFSYNTITKEDLETPLDYGRTSLHFATSNGCSKIINFLLQNGVRVNPADEDGMRPIHFVKTAEDATLLLGYYKNLTDAFERNHIGRNPLHTASQNGHAHVIKLFLSHQIEVSACDTAKWTPLLLAAYADKVECVRILLQHGADVNEANDQSKTALHLAVQNGSRPIIDVLLDNGADVKLKDCHGNTVLHSVLECYQRRTWFVESPIHDSEVARHNVMELVDVLLERGADPFEVNCDGESAIDIVNELELNEFLQKMSGKRRRLNEVVGVP